LLWHSRLCVVHLSLDEASETAQRICVGLRIATDVGKRAGALSRVSRLEARKKDMRTRRDVLRLGGVDIVIECLGDAELNAKAANALGALCMSDEIAAYVLSDDVRGVVLSKLEGLAMSQDYYKIGDASFTLGMLVLQVSEPASLFADMTALAQHLSTMCTVSIGAENFTESHRNMRVFVCVLLHKIVVAGSSTTRGIVVDSGFVGVLLSILRSPRYRDDLLHIAIATLKVLCSDRALRQQLLDLRVLACIIRFSVAIESEAWGLLPAEVATIKAAAGGISAQLTTR
ncbi:hypothetical protein SARC_06133, partial [Sphaeroforma arctica JP610]